VPVLSRFFSAEAFLSFPIKERLLPAKSTVDLMAQVEIFQQWHAEFGAEDTDERVRIAIIEGDIPGQLEGYTVHLTTNPDYLVTQIKRSPELGDHDHHIATLCRFNRMEKTHRHQGLERFKSTVNALRKYLVLPAIYNQRVSTELRPLLELAILKREIHFRHVQEMIMPLHNCDKSFWASFGDGLDNSKHCFSSS
jgi:hypothetical protein